MAGTAANPYPVAENPTTGERKQWNGSAWVQLPSGRAPGSAFLPPAGQFGKDPSEAANFNKWRQTQDSGVTNARSAMAQDREMEGLLARQKTGGMYALPVVGGALGMFDPEIRRIEALSSESARSKRTPGEGTISDFDARMFQQQVPGRAQPTQTNRAIIQADRLRSDAVLQRREMADWYYQTFGHSRGFEEAWDRYAQANPIFDPASESEGRPILNANRQNWRQFFGGVRGPGDERGTQAESDVRRAATLQSKERLGQSTKPLDMQRVTPAALKTAQIYRNTKAPSGTKANPWLPVTEEEFNRIPAGRDGGWYINPADGRVLQKAQ